MHEVQIFYCFTYLIKPFHTRCRVLILVLGLARHIIKTVTGQTSSAAGTRSVFIPRVKDVEGKWHTISHR